jgi:5'-deoxynucleotidase
MSAFLAWIFRMPLIKRWSLMFTHRSEDIAQHSHQVAVVAHLLAVIKNKKFGGNLDPNKAAVIGLYHEASEVIHSDLPNPTKYLNKNITREFKKIELEAEYLCLNSLPEEFREDFNDIILSEKIDPEYKKIVKAADLFCAYIKTLTELKHHNYEFEHVKSNLILKLAELKKDMPELAYLENTFASHTTATLDEIYKKM